MKRDQVRGRARRLDGVSAVYWHAVAPEVSSL